MPRESRNKTFYHIDELKKFDGLTVPLRFNHIQTPEAVIGEAHFTFDEEKGQVKYVANITNSFYQDLVENKLFQVSIGATVLKHSEMCDNSGRPCLHAPVLGSIDELSIVETPGIPESTLNIIEKFKEYECMPCGTMVKHCNESLFVNTSNNQTILKTDIMPETTPTEVPKEPEVVAPIETPKVEVPKVIEAVVDNFTKPKEAPKVEPENITNAVKDAVVKETSSLFKEIREHWVPNSEVPATVQESYENDYTDEEAKKILEKSLQY